MVRKMALILALSFAVLGPSLTVIDATSSPAHACATTKGCQ